MEDTNRFVAIDELHKLNKMKAVFNEHEISDSKKQQAIMKQAIL